MVQCVACPTCCHCAGVSLRGCERVSLSVWVRERVAVWAREPVAVALRVCKRWTVHCRDAIALRVRPLPLLPVVCGTLEPEWQVGSGRAKPSSYPMRVEFELPRLLLLVA